MMKQTVQTLNSVLVNNGSLASLVFVLFAVSCLVREQHVVQYELYVHVKVNWVHRMKFEDDSTSTFLTHSGVSPQRRTFSNTPSSHDTPPPPLSPSASYRVV